MKRLATPFIILLTVLPGIIAAQNCNCDTTSDQRYGEDCFNDFYEPDEEGPLAHQKERGMYVRLVKTGGEIKQTI